MRIRHAIVLRLPPGWMMPEHVHEACEELEVIIAGRIETRIAGRTLINGPGTCKRHPAGMPHGERLLGTTGARLLFVSFVSEPGSRADLPLHGVDRGGHLAAALRWLMDVHQQQPAGAADEAGHILAAIDGFLRRSVHADGALAAQVRALVAERLAEPFRLDDFAAAAHLSRFHYLRRFRAETGTTPMRFLRRLRLEAARGIRAATGMPLRSIAPVVGLGDGDRLSRLLAASADGAGAARG